MGYGAGVKLAAGPVYYSSLRSGGQGIRAKLGIPVALALAPNLESNVTWHTLLYGFRGGILDEEGEPVLTRSGVFKAVEYAQNLFEDAGSPEQLAWGSSGNVRAMLSRKTSCTINAISLSRAAEKQDPEIANKMLLYPPLKGPGVILAIPHLPYFPALSPFTHHHH